jgi:hypothetical protein
MRTVSVPVPHVSGTENSVLGSILPKKFMFQNLRSWVFLILQIKETPNVPLFEHFQNLKASSSGS